MESLRKKVSTAMVRVTIADKVVLYPLSSIIEDKDPGYYTVSGGVGGKFTIDQVDSFEYSNDSLVPLHLNFKVNEYDSKVLVAFKKMLNYKGIIFVNEDDYPYYKKLQTIISRPAGRLSNAAVFKYIAKLEEGKHISELSIVFNI